MRFLDSLRFRIAALFHRSEIDAELHDELRSHLQHRADDLEHSGLSRAEAERRARIEFGGQERFKEECREAAGVYFLETLRQDLRFAFRMLRKSPGFAVVAVVTLALGIGANVVVFGVLNALVLRPVNVPQAESLYAIERGRDKAVNHSYLDYADLRDRNRSFESLAAYNVTSVGLDTGNHPVGSWILEVTGNYFDVLAIQPYLGRFFHGSDEHGPGSAPYIVLTYAYWHAHFQDDRAAVGRTVLVNKHPFTIVGVAPPEFRGTISFVFPDFWVPIVQQGQIEGSYVLNARGNRDLLMVLGHLKAGVTPAQAISDLNSIGADLEETYPKDDNQMTFALARPGLTGDWLGGPVKGFLTGLMLLAGLILLAACANLGTLFAARSSDRSRELAVRLALGAGRVRIVRQLFTEAVIVSLMGGAAGLWGSVLLLRALSAWQPLSNAPIHLNVTPDWNVYLVALLLAVASGIIFGAVPVRQILRTDPYQVIKSGSTRAAGRRMTVRDLLLAVQIAICAVLVTSSLVAVRGLVRSLHSNFGFEPQHAMLVSADLTTAGYSVENAPAMEKRMIETMKAVPGVESAGMVDRPPLYYGANSSNVFADKTTDLRSSNAAAEAMMYRISPEYFDAAETALLTGRIFTSHDDRSSPRVAVVNRTFATKIFGSVSNAIGAYYKLADAARIQVVGIVEDGKYASLTEDPEPAMFLPLLQWPGTQESLVVRSRRDPKQMAEAVKKAMTDLDAGLPYDLETWNQELEASLLAPRIATVALGVLGTMAAMLAITGIFGMAAYSVSKRLKELGIRMALGAGGKEVVKAALGRPLRLLTFGSLGGLLLGLAATKVLSAIVYAATPRDPVVLAGVVLAMMLLGLVSTWIPARRALSIDPLVLLRDE